ncbi:CYFA0S24e01684g1_1 [Cyberlindnera fabianii]|uniref:CYFA0S24e01684g1_1 n=1 Tax=Cyberlindnera fabianii TaxID=36022 RepID=A0A061BI27_CYBFA|nr:hypothetical protein BON22_2782 [Cyberlindnera fabianii]CDR46637.1 CYFA0S24e01684g1_1 [Cyberlindnera fabianii]
MRSSKQPGLPQPYNMRPKRSAGLTTPQKKLLMYFLALFCIGFFLWEASRASKVETEVLFDSEMTNERKGIKNKASVDLNGGAVVPEAGSPPLGPDAANAAGLAGVGNEIKAEAGAAVRAAGEATKKKLLNNPNVVQQVAVGPGGVGVDKAGNEQPAAAKKANAPGLA